YLPAVAVCKRNDSPGRLTSCQGTPGSGLVSARLGLLTLPALCYPFIRPGFAGHRNTADDVAPPGALTHSAQESAGQTAGTFPATRKDKPAYRPRHRRATSPAGQSPPTQPTTGHHLPPAGCTRLTDPLARSAGYPFPAPAGPAPRRS